MIPLSVVENFVKDHFIRGGTRIELLKSLGQNSLVAELLADASTRNRIESMSHGRFLSFVAALLSNFLNPSRRKRIPQFSTIDAAVKLIKESKKVLVLTGAGISTSCGIPDFRSANGVYSMLGDFKLDDPQDLFSISYFRRNVKPFYKFAKQLWPGTHSPAATHWFIREFEKRGKLLRNYTQNIDTLEYVAGIKNVIQCHGSFATATCTKCAFQCSGEEIKTKILSEQIPLCPKCENFRQTTAKTHSQISVSSSCADSKARESTRLDVTAAEKLPSLMYSVDPLFEKGVLKPDIVFFGESLPKHFFDSIEKEVDECDLVIVAGTSLKVAPVSKIISLVDESVPQILINREVVARPHEFDLEFLGNCDAVAVELAKQLGWGIQGDSEPLNEERNERMKNKEDLSFRRSNKSGKTNRYLFDGAVESDESEGSDASDDEEDIDPADQSLKEAENEKKGEISPCTEAGTSSSSSFIKRNIEHENQLEQDTPKKQKTEILIKPAEKQNPYHRR